MNETENTCKELPSETLARLSEGEPILKFFAYEHLPDKLRLVSLEFGVVAVKLMELPRSAERTIALRKLLESKDAAVRAAL